MGAAREFALWVIAFAAFASGCTSHSTLANNPPAGMPNPSIDWDVVNSAGTGPSASLAPPIAAQPPAPPAAPSPQTVADVSAVKTLDAPWTQRTTASGSSTPLLRVGIDGARAVSPGDAIPLEVSVSNTGTGPATNVKLRADFDAALTHESGVRALEVSVGTLAPGQSQTVPLTLRAAQPGKPAIQVVASGDGGLHSEAARSIAIAQRALQFSLSGAATRYVNRPGTWDVRVANIGDAGLTNVTARVRLPRELRFQSASGGGQLVAGEVVWAVGELRPGERRELQVTATPVAGAGQATLTGLAAADKVPAQSAEAAFEVMGMPVLRADVVPPANGIPVGGKGVVIVRVTNQGTLAARNVVVRVVAPAPYLALRFGTGPTVGRVQGDKVEFAPVSRIEPEQTVTFQIEVAGGQPGDGRMRVQVHSESTPTPLIVEEAIRIVPTSAPAQPSPAAFR